MVYATQQDFIDRFGEQEMVELTNLYAPAATTIDADVLAQNQESAFATINGIISNCPAVAALLPLSSPYPALLVTFELDLTRYHLDTLGERPGVKERAQEVMRLLEMIGKCEMSLGLDGDGTAIAAQNNAYPRKRAFTAEPSFGGRSLRYYGTSYGRY